MAGKLIRIALRRSLRDTRHISPVRWGSASQSVAAVYLQVERDFGLLAPPVALHSPAPEPLAACWIMLRESLLASGRAERAVKEVVAAAVSLGNSCPYCVAVHGATVHGLIRGGAAQAIAEDRLDAITDPKIKAIALWAKQSGIKGATTREDIPLPAKQLPELIGTAVAFQYLNRMVNVFLGDSPLPRSVPDKARGTVMKVLGGLMGSSARIVLQPGASLKLLPAASAEPDLAWSAGNTVVTDAFARVAAAIDKAGARSIPPAVRTLVTSRLDEWTGTPMGISRDWVDAAVSGLSIEYQPAGRLALLTAFASYQVDRSVVDAFRPEDPNIPNARALIELTSWASFTAARRVGAWLWGSARSEQA